MTTKMNSTEIKKILKSGTIVIGTQSVIKNLKLGNVANVLVSSNCPSGVENSINYYAGLSGAVVNKLDLPNDELGVLCKKPFLISVLALLKGATK